MTAEDRRRLVTMEHMRAGRLKLVDASRLLSISYRQAKRIWARYQQEGAAGLLHRNRGRPSNKRKASEVREAVLERYEERYSGFGPTLAAEKLQKDGYEVDHETLRRWLLAAGLWKRQRRRKSYRSRRERKAHFGEMIQIDGSHHKWFEDRGTECCLMSMIDDATGRRASYMAEEETTEAAMMVFWSWVEKYGIPHSVYLDRLGVYVTDREPTLEEQLEGIEPKTAFGKALEKLGVKIITSYSPQARGRVERCHGVYQDRLVKEFRLENVSSIHEANAILLSSFVDEINEKFALDPRSEQDYHMPVPKDLDLRNVFCWESPRKVQSDWVVRNDNRYFQILRGNRPMPRVGDTVLVRQWLDRSIHLFYKDKEIKMEEIVSEESARQRRVS
jgi:transposase